MDLVYRPCCVCSKKLMKRALPDNFPFKGQLPEWFMYECMNCGTLVLIQPFANIRQVAKG